MRSVTDGFSELPSTQASPRAPKPLRVLADNGTLITIRWTPNGIESEYRGNVSPDMAYRINAAIRREWVFGIGKDVTAFENLTKEMRHHERQHGRDTKYPRIGPPVGHWTDGLGVLPAQYAATCRICGERWELGDSIAWHRVHGPFHFDCAKHARDHRLPVPETSKFCKPEAPLPPWPPPGEAPHFTDRWRVVRAGRPSTCDTCGSVIAVGEPILWSSEDRLARHHACGVYLRIDSGAGLSGNGV